MVAEGGVSALLGQQQGLMANSPASPGAPGRSSFMGQQQQSALTRGAGASPNAAAAQQQQQMMSDGAGRFMGQQQQALSSFGK